MRRGSCRTRIVPLLVEGTLLGAGCSRSQQGALYGAAGGALLGQAIGRSTEATLLGAGLGAAVGHAIGREADPDAGCRCEGGCPHR